MGTCCLYSCQRQTKLDNNIRASLSTHKRSSENGGLLKSQIVDNVQQSKLLNTTLLKNKNLQSLCQPIRTIKSSIHSFRSADKGLNFAFTLTSKRSTFKLSKISTKMEEQQKEASSDENIEQSLQEKISMTKDEMIENDGIPYRRASTQVDKPKKSIRSNIFRFSKDFLRILKVNISQRFSFQQKLGEGAQGCVYRAIDRKTLESRAVKVIHKNIIKNQLNFFAQFEILGILDHPNIVKLFEIIDYNDHYYLVTEYCQGGAITQQLQRVKNFSQDSVRQIMKELLTALTYIHNRNIIHRDLKLQNIMFQRRPTSQNPPSIKIIDFGTSKILQQSSNEMLQRPAGTPLYIAPEVLKGSYNNKCDLWSCGVIMYILLSGKAPFGGRTKKEVYNKIQFSPLSFQDKVWNKVSIEAKRLIQKLLEKNRKLRITAKEALSSPWIREGHRSQIIGPEVLQNIEKFQFRDRFVAIILTYLASTSICQKRRRNLAAAFISIDRNNSGCIEIEEFLQAYKKLDDSVDEAYISSIFKSLDTDGSGRMDFTQFLVAAEKQQHFLQKELLEKAFDFFDKNQKGYLCMADLNEILGECEQKEVCDVMSQLDSNKDTYISREQFVRRLIRC